VRLQSHLEHPTVHAALTNVLHGQHHSRPDGLSFSDNSLTVYPQPFGPNALDITVPYETKAAVVSLRSPHVTEMAGGVAGAVLIVTRLSTEATGMSLGGHGVLATGSYNAIYSKAASAINLTHKVFSSAGGHISLTDILLYATGASTRVLRMWWTNYDPAIKTLDVIGEAALYA